MTKGNLCKWEVKMSGRVTPIVIVARSIEEVVKDILNYYPEICVDDIYSITYLAG